MELISDDKPVGKSISDMMRSRAAEYEKLKMTGNNVLADRVIGKTMLNTESDYSFCPRCADKNRRSFGKEWKAHIQPMWAERHKLLLRISEKVGKISYETKWICPNCNQYVTEDDFIAVYCAGKAESSLVDLTNVNLNDPNFGRYF